MPDLRAGLLLRHLLNRHPYCMSISNSILHVTDIHTTCSGTACLHMSLLLNCLKWSVGVSYP